VFDSVGVGSAHLVRSKVPPLTNGNWALDSRIPIRVSGHSVHAEATLQSLGTTEPLSPRSEVRSLLEGDDLPDTGSIVVGTRGAMVIPHVARPLLYPDKKFKDLPLPRSRLR